MLCGNIYATRGQQIRKGGFRLLDRDFGESTYIYFLIRQPRTKTIGFHSEIDLENLKARLKFLSDRAFKLTDSERVDV
jgi:hypothetical protein